MEIKKLLADSENHILAFISKNWGLAISIKSKMKYPCDNSELLDIAIDAFQQAFKTYDEKRNIDNGRKYDFANHWGQMIKSIITTRKKQQLREVLLDEHVQNYYVTKKNSNCELNKRIKASEIISLLGEKKAEEVVLLYRHGLCINEISRETKVPISKVSKVISIINEIIDD